jgi:hypothetical protein
MLGHVARGLRTRACARLGLGPRRAAAASLESYSSPDVDMGFLMASQVIFVTRASYGARRGISAVTVVPVVLILRFGRSGKL